MRDMSKADKAATTFTEGFNCAQSIVATFGPDLGLDRTDALRVASGFGGGMGRMAQTCGVVTGAFMVLGLRFGHTSPDDTDAKARTEELCREFVRRFRERNGSFVCRDLLGCDISTEEGRAEAKELGLSERKCRGFVRDSAEILVELLEG
jgi:C_GCAxxG_C_C family probable redox protein